MQTSVDKDLTHYPHGCRTRPKQLQTAI